MIKQKIIIFGTMVSTVVIILTSSISDVKANELDSFQSDFKIESNTETNSSNISQWSFSKGIENNNLFEIESTYSSLIPKNINITIESTNNGTMFPFRLRKVVDPYALVEINILETELFRF